ncbi:hypothetical protein SELMODRAFT_426422 [Selaginella moellendorffii]|uniref:Uncharacterized protein n=1 Tax=Selaginella moellendorffii TaxID=88036 RepID=D8SWB4_SELML|nr:hypothetical protein SELMODRAFT_426422 [Selaginella moellendorffii]
MELFHDEKLLKPWRRLQKKAGSTVSAIFDERFGKDLAVVQGVLFRKPVDLLQFYADFELDDQKGLDVNVLKRHAISCEESNQKMSRRHLIKHVRLYDQETSCAKAPLRPVAEPSPPPRDLPSSTIQKTS